MVDKFDNKHIFVNLFDGNKIAINYQNKLIQHSYKFLKVKQNKLSYKLWNIEFVDKDDLENKIDVLNFNNKLDIIQIFKFVNEFYSNDYENNKGMYYQLLKSADKWLGRDGIILILDITNIG